MSKIIEHTSNGFKWLLVEVPEGAKEFDLPEQDYGNVLQYKTKHWESEMLPSGSWEIVGKADSLTDQQKNKVVEDDFMGTVRRWKDYKKPNSFLYHPRDSFLSLLRSHGLKPENALLLEAIK